MATFTVGEALKTSCVVCERLVQDECFGERVVDTLSVMLWVAEFGIEVIASMSVRSSHIFVPGLEPSGASQIRAAPEVWM